MRIVFRIFWWYAGYIYRIMWECPHLKFFNVEISSIALFKSAEEQDATRSSMLSVGASGLSNGLPDDLTRFGAVGRFDVAVLLQGCMGSKLV